MKETQMIDSFPSPRITITKSGNVFGETNDILNGDDEGEDVFNLFRKKTASSGGGVAPRQPILNNTVKRSTVVVGNVVELEVPPTVSRSSSLSSLIDDLDSDSNVQYNNNDQKLSKPAANHLLGDNFCPPYNIMKASSESICLHSTEEEDLSSQIKESKPHDRILKELLLNEFGLAESSTLSSAMTSSTTPNALLNSTHVTTTKEATHPSNTLQIQTNVKTKVVSKTSHAATSSSTTNSHQKSNTPIRPKVNSHNGSTTSKLSSRHPRPGSAPLKKASHASTKPEDPKNSKVDPLILNLEKAMNTLYVKPQTEPQNTPIISTMIVVTPEPRGDSPSPFTEHNSTSTKSSSPPLSLPQQNETSHHHEQTLKKPPLSIKIESPSHVNSTSKTKLVKYEGTRVYQGKNQTSSSASTNIHNSMVPPSQPPQQQQQKHPKSQTTSNNCKPPSSSIGVTTGNNDGDASHSKSQQPSPNTNHNNNQKLCVWDRIKLGSNAIQKRIDTMKTSLQRGGSQLSLTTMLAPTLSATNGTSKNNLLSDLKRIGSKRELSTPKPKIPNDIFNTSSILFKIHDLIQNKLLRERETRTSDKVKWRLKKKFKRLIAQQQSEKKDRQLIGIYEHRKRLTRFQMQAVLNTVDPLRLIPQHNDNEEGPPQSVQKSHSAIASNHFLKSGTSSNENSARNSIHSNSNGSSNNSTLIDYHEKNREEIMKQQKILEQLASELFQQDHNSRKVKFGDEKSTNSSTNNSSTQSSIQEKSSVDSLHQECHHDHSTLIRNRISNHPLSQRPHSAPLRGVIAANHDQKKNSLQDMMIEKEVSKRKANAFLSNASKSSHSSKHSSALSKTFSETKLKLFNPYAPKVPLKDAYCGDSGNASQQDEHRAKNKGNTLVIEFQKMVLQENELKQGALNHSSVTSEIEEGPTTDLYDFSSVNPFDAVKNMNITSKPQHMPEMQKFSSFSNAEKEGKKAIIAQQQNPLRKRVKIKPPLDTGLKIKEKRDPVLTTGIVCDIGKFTLC